MEPEVDVPALIQLVRGQPALWDTASQDYGHAHKVTTAWKHICKASWPDYDKSTAIQKRTKCLELQRKWNKLRQSFIRRPDTHQHRELLSFLPAAVQSTDQSDNDSKDGETPAKRRREESQEQEEDRLFLLSLVSFLRDVPRSSRLALRADMIQLIAKYTGQASTDSPQY